jgi:hypothetical protein
MLGLELAPDFGLAPWASNGGLNPNARAAAAVVAKIVVRNLIVSSKVGSSKSSIRPDRQCFEQRHFCLTEQMLG